MGRILRVDRFYSERLPRSVHGDSSNLVRMSVARTQKHLRYPPDIGAAHLAYCHRRALDHGLVPREEVCAWWALRNRSTQSARNARKKENRRSGALLHRFQDRHALDMAGHREHVDFEGQPDTQPASGPHLVLISEVRPRLPAGSALPKQLVHAARPGLQIAKLQHELLESCSSHRDLMAVPSNDHDRLGCLHLSSARQCPLSVQPMLAKLVNKVVGRQCHGEDEKIRDDAGTLRRLERIDTPRHGHGVARRCLRC